MQLSESQKDLLAGTLAYGAVIAVGGLLVMALVAGITIGCTNLTVWHRGKMGEADLRKASQTRQIQVIQAQAELQSADDKATAIRIVGQAAKDYPEYRYQEFLQTFAEAIKDNRRMQLVYVPTEGQIPVLEAGRFQEGK